MRLSVQDILCVYLPVPALHGKSGVYAGTLCHCGTAGGHPDWRLQSGVSIGGLILLLRVLIARIAYPIAA